MADYTNESRTTEDLIKALNEFGEIFESIEKSQLQTGKGNEPKHWAGSSKEELDDEKEWTDKKSATDMSKAQPMLPFQTQEAPEEEEEEEEEDKKAPKKNGKKPCPEDMDKSVQEGVEVSQFLVELTKSIAEYTLGVKSYISKSIEQIQSEHNQVLVGLAHNLVAINGQLEKSQGNIQRFAKQPARGPKAVTDINKSQTSSEVLDTSTLTKAQVLPLLTKGVEEGRIPEMEVLRLEAGGVGAVNPTILKSLFATA